MPTQHICPRWLVGIGVALLLLVAITLTLPSSSALADTNLPPERSNEATGEVASDSTIYYDQRDSIADIDALTSAIRWNLLRPNIITYTVQEGDNDWSIARRFGLDVDTLRYSNAWMKDNPDLIQPGEDVVILPVRGATYCVQDGDTVQSIAARYSVSSSDIARFPLNELAAGAPLRPGQTLIVPGGRLDHADQILPPSPATGYALAWPMRGIVSQGYHTGHRALDVATDYGAKVYASRGGRVIYAQFSPGGWLGFRVVIAHDNGLRTAYNHMSGIFVEVGQDVARGEVIGQVGSTGNSTGPHVHFEVMQNGFPVDPGKFLPPASEQ